MKLKAFLSTVLVVTLIYVPSYGMRQDSLTIYDKEVYNYIQNKSFNRNSNFLSTYEKSLLGLSFLAIGDLSSSQSMVQKSLQQKENLIGPNLWVALLCLQYDRISRSSKYRAFALKICDWFCALPHYSGLPVMGENKGVEQIPWNRIVALEDSYLGQKVLKLAQDMTSDRSKKDLYKSRLQLIHKSLKLYSQLPENSFLLMAFLPNSLQISKARGYKISRTVYLCSEDDLSGIENANNVWDFLSTYWNGLQAQDGMKKEKVARYNRLKEMVYCLDRFVGWKVDNQIKMYEKSCQTLVNSKQEWYLPKSHMSDLMEKGMANVCWDLFKSKWNPFERKKIPSQLKLKQAFVLGKESTKLSEQARIHLLAGEIEKAEQVANACVNLYSEDQKSREEVAFSWLILGKIYHDRSQEAASSFKFAIADDLQEKRDNAFQQVKRHNLMNSVEPTSRYNFKRVFQVIKNIYN